MPLKQNIDIELLESFVAGLSTLPQSQVGKIAGERIFGAGLRAEATVEARIGDHSLLFAIKSRKNVYPRDARDVLEPLQDFADAPAHPQAQIVPMLLAHSVSESARRMFQKQRVGYCDLGGSLHIATGALLILIDRPIPRPAQKRDLNLFRGSRARVLMALFARNGRWVTGTEISAEGGISTATVSQTFKTLERRDWIEVSGKGPSKRRRLTRPTELLDAWRDALLAAPPIVSRRYEVPRLRPEELAWKLRSLANAEQVPMELTGQMAARSYAPHPSEVTQVSVRLPEGTARDRILAALDATEVPEGGNLALITPDPPAPRGPPPAENDGFGLAAPLQVYLDLLSDPTRPRELAEHLRSRTLQ